MSSMAPEPIGPYSQGVASGGYVFLSGQVGRKHDATELEKGVAAKPASYSKHKGRIS